MAQLLEVCLILALKLNPVTKISHQILPVPWSKMGFPEYELLV